MARIKGSVKIEGMAKFLSAIDDKIAEVGKDAKPAVAVGYSADYAIFVHEDLKAYHPNGQAKFLENAIKENETELARFLEERIQKGDTLSKALFYLGDKLGRKSDAKVPVDTGFLKKSRYVKVISGREIE